MVLIGAERNIDMSTEFKNTYFGFYENYGELMEKINALRVLGAKISMTQGVYDLYHPGHKRYLKQAQSFGDILVVAVDSDEYTRLRKQSENERRPVVPFDERVEILSSVRFVNILTVRNSQEHEIDPYHVIKIVHPDVLVLSRSTKDITEKDYEALREFCGDVQVLDPTAVISTTKRLRELLMDGAGILVDRILEVIHDHFQQAGREVVMSKRKDKVL